MGKAGKETENEASASEVFSFFCETTSAHGFIDLRHSRTKIFKVFWVIIITTLMSLCAYMNYDHMQRYLEYPVATSFEEKLVDSLDIPPMVVCNLQVYDAAKAEELRISTPLVTIIMGAFMIVPDGENQAPSEDLKDFVEKAYEMRRNGSDVVMALPFILNQIGQHWSKNTKTKIVDEVVETMTMASIDRNVSQKQVLAVMLMRLIDTKKGSLPTGSVVAPPLRNLVGLLLADTRNLTTQKDFIEETCKDPSAVSAVGIKRLTKVLEIIAGIKIPELDEPLEHSFVSRVVCVSPEELKKNPLANPANYADFKKYKDTMELATAISYTCRDMMTKCSFAYAEYDCCAETLVESFMSDSGLCYKVRPYYSQAEDGVARQQSLGSKTAFSAILDPGNVDKKLANNFRSWEAHGLIVGFANEYTKDKSAVMIPPGTYTEVKIAKKVYKRLPKKAACSSSSKYLRNFNEYSMDACQAECNGNITLEECGCVLDIMGTNLTRAGVPGCDPLQALSCIMPTFNAYTSVKNDAGSRAMMKDLQACWETCEPLCEEVLHIPAAVMTAPLVRLNESLPKHMSVLRVAFDAMRETHIVQQELMTSDDLFAAIGGTLGLMLGASVMTFIQCFGFVCWYCERKVGIKNGVASATFDGPGEN